MAKYNVTFSCGHTHVVAIAGSVAEQERKAQWYKDCGVCPDCYAAKKASAMEAEYEKVEMHYGDYKREYSDCKTVRDSYNAATKTIVVYVPRNRKTASQKNAEKAEYDENVRFIANISKSEMFKRAHSYTKKLLADANGVHYDYRATFGLVLKAMYEDIKLCHTMVAA